MEITEIRVFQKEGQDKKLKAYATVTFDNAFVVRNIKVIQGSNGLFIAMPSRKMKRLCHKCHFKNEVGSKFCNHCGETIKSESQNTELLDAKTEHRDIAHPITQQFREYLQTKILEAYDREIVAEGSLGSPSERVSSEVN
ncbi:MAG: septation protein SpoVG family protein [Candidatus Omnitrophica bacterium]|nr:septation protein SpoVG family protein [Candidatus Omnitrophota bacterium]